MALKEVLSFEDFKKAIELIDEKDLLFFETHASTTLDRGNKASVLELKVIFKHEGNSEGVERTN